MHTRARNEKALSAELIRRRVEHYLPLVRHYRMYDGRNRPVQLPLFPGYVFLCGSNEDRQAALQTNRVAHVLEVPDQERLHLDLQQIDRIVRSGEPTVLYPHLQPGCRCRVVRGSLRGLEGVVLREPARWRVYVGVDFLGQSAELQIDPGLLEVAD